MNIAFIIFLTALISGFLGYMKGVKNGVEETLESFKKEGFFIKEDYKKED